MGYLYGYLYPQFKIAVNIFSGADFTPNFDASDVSNQDWGTLNLDFSVNDNLSVNWVTNLPGYIDGQIETTRLTLIKGRGCL